MNPSDRTFLVRLELQDNTALTVGAAVDAVIELRSDQRQLTVPQDAVIRYSDGRTAVHHAALNGSALSKSRPTFKIYLERFFAFSGARVALAPGLLVWLLLGPRGSPSLLSCLRLAPL